ncbi:hypothetical protein GCM10023208_23660 [Erythrobacter westpacificensis]|uniref:Uncharacterized protein n=1 Tax=Erythrobacter westpacificensis TaxID=1055231 RepID=A0ABP9KI87_9SPHN
MDEFEEHFERWARGDAPDPSLSAIYGNDGRFPHVHEDGVIAALANYPLDLVNGRSMNWLALMVRRAFGVCVPQLSAMPQAIEAAKDTRAQIVKLTASFEKASQLIGAISEVAEAQLMAMDDEAWDRFQAISKMLPNAVTDLRNVAAGIEIPTGPWRSQAAKELRTRQAHVLMQVFELAFGEEATVNGWKPAENYGVWPDFFFRMHSLAIGIDLSPDQLRAAVDDAASRPRFSLPHSIFPES